MNDDLKETMYEEFEDTIGGYQKLLIESSVPGEPFFNNIKARINCISVQLC